MDSKLLIAILTSSVATAFITSFLTSYKEDRKLRQERLEALYMHVFKWIKTYSVYALNFQYAINGEMTLKAVYELMKGLGNSEDKHSLEKIEMIIGVYFPALKSNFDAVILFRKDMNTVITKFETDSENNKIDKSKYNYLEESNKEFDKLDVIEADFKKAIFKEAHALTKPFWKIWS